MDRERERIIKQVFHKPKEVTQEHSETSGVVMEPNVNPELLKMFPPEKLEKIKAKALRRYKHRQDIQWERYLESMNR